MSTNAIDLSQCKVAKVEKESITFDNGVVLQSEHQQDCCESHYLSFADLTMADFDGLVFDLSMDSFFDRVEDYGIRLIPVGGHAVSVPGYGSNNGYYSSNLGLEILDQRGNRLKWYNITECQEWEAD